jgi:hypothetical protein
LGSELGAAVAQYELAEPLEEVEVGAAAPWEPTEPLVVVEEKAANL